MATTDLITTAPGTQDDLTQAEHVEYILIDVLTTLGAAEQAITKLDADLDFDMGCKLHGARSLIEQALGLLPGAAPSPLEILTLDQLQETARTLAGAAHEAGYVRDENAINKAALHLTSGIRPAPVGANEYLVQSATNGGIVYRVGATGCNCEAGSRNFPCWHAAMISIVTSAHESFTIDLSARRDDAETTVQETAYERAMREIDELF
jgi:hypothetical protein